MEKPIIYTIGHSTHTMDEFIAILQSFNIKIFVDIRRLPGSRKYPQFDQENLKVELANHQIKYIYMKDLGGRRKVSEDSKNTRWNNPSFRAYADYMETSDFEKAIADLEHIALQAPTVYMCAEAVWWRCHRALISDYLKNDGWKVLHITAVGKAREHVYTSPAQIIENQLSYTDQI